MSFIRFLTFDEVLFIHNKCLEEFGGIDGLRDEKILKSSIGAPQATFNKTHLMDLFEMAGTYAYSIAMNHPFLDGNKRTAALSATIFLYYNGYLLKEKYDEELADQILSIIAHKTGKNDLVEYLRKNSKSKR